MEKDETLREIHADAEEESQDSNQHIQRDSYNLFPFEMLKKLLYIEIFI